MDLEKIRKELLEKREAILEHLNNTSSEDINHKDGVEDAADVVASELNRETFYKLTQAERETLFLIDLALKKIESGTYGICEECGATIGEKRLEAIPWVRLCIECSQNEETMKMFSSSDDISYYNIIPNTTFENEEDRNIIE